MFLGSLLNVRGAKCVFHDLRFAWSSATHANGRGLLSFLFFLVQEITADNLSRLPTLEDRLRSRYRKHPQGRQPITVLNVTNFLHISAAPRMPVPKEVKDCRKGFPRLDCSCRICCLRYLSPRFGNPFCSCSGGAALWRCDARILYHGT